VEKPGQYGLRPKKSLGQNFLCDDNIVRKIISLAGLTPEATVLEIGPGLGALTVPLAKEAGQVVAVEKDPQLVRVLEERLSSVGIRNVKMVEGDILKVDMTDLVGSCDRPVTVMGNLPYNISTPLLGRLIEARKLISRAVLMFQSEVAARIAAPPGSRVYGAMSVMVQYHAGVRPLLKVPPSAFRPRPRVSSVVVEIDLRRPHRERASNEYEFERVVRGAFSHRRKTLVNSLRGGEWDRETLLEALMECSLDPGTRAESLGISQFICLSEYLSRKNEEKGRV